MSKGSCEAAESAQRGFVNGAAERKSDRKEVFP